MAAQRIFNLFAAQTGTSGTGGSPTQIVGPQSLSISHGFREIVADESDGVLVTPAQDRGAWFAEGTLEHRDITTWMAQLALWEAAATGRAILAEGREVGAATVTQIIWKRTRLVSSALRLMTNQYASCSYGLRSSCAAASDTQDDELSFTSGGTKTATIGSGKRTYRIVSAIHNSVQAFACDGININVQGQAQASVGDAEFGETVEVGPYRVSGDITFLDYTVASLLAKAQTLMAAAAASLALVLTQQGGGSTSTLTLALVKFFSVSEAIRSGDYWKATLKFGCEGVSGTTPYGLASGTNKIITIA